MNRHNGPSPMAAAAVLLLTALLIYPVLALLTGEGTAPAPADDQSPRVLLIGLDAADWIMLDRWFEQGELPGLSRLAATGLRGDLRTLRPIISPLVWTSIATGQTPDRHGVTDFFAGTDGESPLQPVNRRAVLVPTMWETLSARGLEVAVTAWWASWPADHSLNGRVVTDQVQFAFPGPVRGAETASSDSLYHPGELAGRLEHCLVTPGELDARAVGAIVPCTPGDLAPDAADPAPALLRRVLAATTTYYRMTREMLREKQPDFTALYFLGTDTVAHLFGQAAETDPRHTALLRYYRLVDAMVEDLCSQVSPSTLVVLVSDHGFYTGEDRPSGDPADFQHQAAAWHRPLGLVLFNAPWIEPGRLDDASVLDIAPTLLWQLLGQRFESLPGRVLAERRAAGADAAPRQPVPHVAGAGEKPVSPDPQRYLEQLRALGYLEEEEAGPMSAARPVIHLADYLQWAGRSGEALEQLEKARNRQVANPDLLARLAIQQSREDDQTGAWHTLSAAIGLGWDPAAHGRLSAAVGICCAAGRRDEGEALLNTFALEGDLSAQALTARAVLAENHGRLPEAVEGYAAALERDPASSHAAHSICRLLAPGDPRLDKLCATLGVAADLRPGDTPVQLNAGKLLLAVGDPESALGPLGRAVHLEPDLVDPRLLLGRALYLSGRPAEAFERLHRGLAWHPAHQRLLAAAGAAAIRAGYAARGAALLERAAEVGTANPHLDAALALTR